MDFHAQLKRPDLPRVDYPFVPRATRLRDRLLAGYLKLFNKRLAPMKPIALVNGMPAYDLTQPPMGSQSGARILRTGFDYMVRKREARPITLVLMANGRCDMGCRHCSAREYMRNGREHLAYGEIIDLIDQFLALNGASVVISGGEPTLHPRLLDIIDHVDKSKATVSMFTNGSRVAEMADDLRGAGLFGTLVSLDSDDPVKHDEYRRREGAFDIALGAVEALRKQDSLVGISTYVTRPAHLDGYVQRIFRLGEELGVHQVFMFDAVPTGAFLHERDLVLTPEDRSAIRELVKAQNASPTGPAVMGQSWVNSEEGFGCFAGFYQLYTGATGEVAPCDFTPITFGNVRDEPLGKIWRRMRDSEEWGVRHKECRMQDPEFRRNTVDLVPEGTTWPVPYETILELRAARDAAAGADNDAL